MTSAPDHQPAIALRTARERARHAHLAEIALLSDQIRDLLTGLAAGGDRRRPGPARIWLLQAQRARRARLRTLQALRRSFAMDSPAEARETLSHDR